LAANAISDALLNRGIGVDDIDMLAAATTWPDTLVPGFASMVHGRVGGGVMDVLSPGGVCAASMQAFKGAVNAIKT
jgi:3-oxoacyl-[acyl-carrier-protein] synthase-3